MSYAYSLRQQAAWIREALDPSTPETQRITLDDIDVEELEAAANEIDRLSATQLTLPEIDAALVAFGVATTQTEVDLERRWEAIKAVSEFLGRIRLSLTQD